MTLKCGVGHHVSLGARAEDPQHNLIVGAGSSSGTDDQILQLDELLPGRLNLKVKVKLHRFFRRSASLILGVEILILVEACQNFWQNRITYRSHINSIALSREMMLVSELRGIPWYDGWILLNYPGRLLAPDDWCSFI